MKAPMATLQILQLLLLGFAIGQVSSVKGMFHVVAILGVVLIMTITVNILSELRSLR